MFKFLDDWNMRKQETNFEVLEEEEEKTEVIEGETNSEKIQSQNKIKYQLVKLDKEIITKQRKLAKAIKSQNKAKSMKLSQQLNENKAA